MESSVRASPLALTVLSLLHVGPLHPYGIQRLIKAWGKDDVVNVGQRGSLYKTINRLTGAGLIAVRNTQRDQQYPERTVYEITDAGRAASRSWLLDMVSTVRNEYPHFPAALSFLMMLEPAAALAALEKRAATVRETVGRYAEVSSTNPGLPRVTMLDNEYAHDLAAAELRWLDRVIADLGSGALTWDENLLEMAKTYLTD